MMTEQEAKQGLLTDLERLRLVGNTEDAFDGCIALPLLSPVRDAVTQGGILPSHAARTLLEIVARNALTDGDQDIISAAILTAIYLPPGHRDAKGSRKATRKAEIAGVQAGRSDKVIRGHKDKYFEAYASAILACVRGLKNDPAQMREFLAQCGVDRPTIDEPTEPGLPVSDPLRFAAGHVTYPIVLSGQVREALDVAYNSCKAEGRAWFTSDTLITLLNIPNSRIQDCFEKTRSGLAQTIREEQQTIPPSERRKYPFVTFEWVERPEIERAWQYAQLDRVRIVTELHIFLAILDGESETNGWLKRLGRDHTRLRAIADRMRHDKPSRPRTPSPR